MRAHSYLEPGTPQLRAPRQDVILAPAGDPPSRAPTVFVVLTAIGTLDDGVLASHSVDPSLTAPRAYRAAPLYRMTPPRFWPPSTQWLAGDRVGRWGWLQARKFGAVNLPRRRAGRAWDHDASGRR